MIEDDLRAALRDRVAAPPHTPALAETVLRRGRRVRARRRAGTAVAVVLAVVGALSLARLDPPAPGPARSLDGPPRVPLFTGQDPATLTTWQDGRLRERPLDRELPVLARTDGSVVVTLAGARGGLALLQPDGALVTVADDLESTAVAVDPTGRRAVVVAGRGSSRVLQELAVPSGEVLRTVALALPLAAAGDPVLPVAYTDLGVLLTVGEGERQRAAVWEHGDGAVVGGLSYAQALGGSGSRGAFRTTDDDRCRTEVAALTTGGRTWRLCRETFASFSPDGRYVLATDAVGRGLVVRDASDGALVREVEVDGGTRAYGWEDARTTLHTTVKGDRTVVVRCDVPSGRCRTVASFPDVGRIPQPVPAVRP